DRVAERVDAKCRLSLIKTTDNQRTKVTRIKAACVDQLDRRIAKLLTSKFSVHSVDLCRIDQTLHMFGKAKDRRALRRVVTADAFENTRPVIDRMGHHMNTCVIPVDQFAVLPNLGRDIHCCNVFSCHKSWMKAPSKNWLTSSSQALIVPDRKPQT